MCPSCQVLLREGTSTCVKCGRKIEPVKTGIDFLDFARMIHPRLVQYLGPIAGNLVAGALVLILLFLLIGIHLLLRWLLWFFA